MDPVTLSKEELRRSQVDYTYEKNQSVSSTLAIYTFLNITAFAIIFYIARSR